MDLNNFALTPGLTRKQHLDNALKNVPESDLQHNCPNCGPLPEVHPDGGKVLVRALKISDDTGSYSQCLICSGYYDLNLNEIGESGHNSKKGWFKDF